MGLYDYVDVVAGDGATIADLRAKLAAAEERERRYAAGIVAAKRWLYDLFWEPANKDHDERFLADRRAVAAALSLAREAIAATEDTPTSPVSGPICDCCRREVENVRGSMFFGSNRLCQDCFAEWYDGDRPEYGKDNSVASIGNWVRKKHGLEPLADTEATP